MVGYTLPEQQQAIPGLQSQMHPRPVETDLPTEDGRLAEYKAAGSGNPIVTSLRKR
ncbi:hypothetical protein V1506DRAFT_549564 [Lipomyces tetrasporus]